MTDNLAHRRPHDYAQVGMHRVIICDTSGCSRWGGVELTDAGVAYCPDHDPLVEVAAIGLDRQLDVDLAASAVAAEAPSDHRDPYVGAGADGARRSAQIDREEADCLDRGTPRYDMLLSSAAAWDRQADELDAADPAEPGVMEAWMADGSHDPADCQGSCGLPADHRLHDAPSCGCGGTHWVCRWPEGSDDDD